jgi:hypothetical protein
MQYLKLFLLFSLFISSSFAEILGNSTGHNRPLCCNSGQIVTIIVVSVIGILLVICCAMYCFPWFKRRLTSVTSSYDNIT